jgi:hypothetical protein
MELTRESLLPTNKNILKRRNDFYGLIRTSKRGMVIGTAILILCLVLAAFFRILEDNSWWTVIFFAIGGGHGYLIVRWHTMAKRAKRNIEHLELLLKEPEDIRVHNFSIFLDAQECAASAFFEKMRETR